MAIAAAHNRGLRHVAAEDMTAVIGVLLARRWQLVSQRQGLICQLHALLAELTAAGAKSSLTCDNAATMLRGIHPVSAADARRKEWPRRCLPTGDG